MVGSPTHLNWFYPQQGNPLGSVKDFQFPTSKVVCVGRNYVEHAKELNNPIPTEPLFFIKPNSTLCDLKSGINISRLPFDCHYEVEVAILIGRTAKAVTQEAASSYVDGVGIGLDLTLRDLQQQLKSKGHPWEKAKAFDDACPISEFLPLHREANLQQLNFSLTINGKIVQQASTELMIFDIKRLISEASMHFTLYPGDIIMTGTPSGVGVLKRGDKLELQLDKHTWRCSVN